MKVDTSTTVAVVELTTATARPGRPKARRRVRVSADIEPWRRQPTESALSAQLLAEFIALGPHRTLQLLSTRTGRSLSSLTNLSSRNDWMPRVRAWREAHLDDEAQTQREVSADVLRSFVGSAHEMLGEMRADGRRRASGMSDRDFGAYHPAMEKLLLTAIGITERGIASGTTVNVHSAPADPNSAEATQVAMAVLSWAAGEAELSGAARQRLAAALGQLAGRTVPGELA